MPPYIVTCPSSRGLGFALTRHLLRTSKLPIVATARSSPSDVKARLLDSLDDVDSKRLDVLRVDVTDEDSIAALASHCREKFPASSSHLHLGVLLPGVLYAEKTPAQLTQANITETLAVNVAGPLLLHKHLTGLLPTKRTKMPSSSSTADDDLSPLSSQSAILATLSARVGSTSDNKLGGWYSYRASKAAVNAAVKSLDLFVQSRAAANAFCVGLHPGTVKTGLSKDFWASVERDGGKKLFEPEQAAENLVRVLGGLKAEQRGRCWDWKGEEIRP
ncbi:MAG: hypothetical protein M1825_002607 [Sarcosagium campestre]|nr:MAG: hypothetical protein M1825_002607 [Sarcosagium campestre]